MSFELRDCTFAGAALPEPFVKFELEALLHKLDLLPKTTGFEGKALSEAWEVLWRKLRSLGDSGGPARVGNHVLDPLAARLGYTVRSAEGEVSTREGMEDGGLVFSTGDGKARLRAWALEIGADFDAPTKRGHAYRYSPSQIAERVLLAKGERLGLLTDGTELRLLLCDPARRQSHIAVGLDRGSGWRGARSVPDSYRLVLALASPAGVLKIPDLTEQARLTQTRVTTKLREQAKLAVTGFVQELLDDPVNAGVLGEEGDKQALAQKLWAEALVVVYRLLFVFKLESSADPARAFSFASTSLWRNTYSPNYALARVVDAFNKGEDTGRMLGEGLRALFRLFQEGLRSSELKVSPLGGMLFGAGSTPLLDRLAWGERAAARLLDNLLWTPRGAKTERQRVHYGSLDVEDLGRVYEALLELEPGIATEPMCRLKRQKLEVVVPLAQGVQYRQVAAVVVAEGDAEDGEAEEESEEEGEEKPARGKTRVEWKEEIRPGTYYLRVGLGRKATGSYYTPHAFVRFLIQETLGPQVAERSPGDDPQPGEILKLKVLDPAMGSGHFLVEACRYLGDKMYEACRLCDELASKAEEGGKGERAAELRKRVEDLPDPNDELLAYLPSRVAEGQESGISQAKAIALSRRLVAVHCLYGVDKNPLAVELAKLSLWLESYAEGLPLTFLDHRLICGDSLTGPFFDKLGTYPKSGEEVRDLFSQKLTARLKETLGEALQHVTALEASIGKDEADIQLKREAKEKLDQALKPFKMLAQAWCGGVMIGDRADDDDYKALMNAVAERQDINSLLKRRLALVTMVEAGGKAMPYDLTFPEVFFPKGQIVTKAGFSAVVGNPPWDRLLPADKEFFAGYDLRVLDAPTKRERDMAVTVLRNRPDVAAHYRTYIGEFRQLENVIERAYKWQIALVDGERTIGKLDAYRAFMERAAFLPQSGGFVGLVVPSGFHANEGATGIRRLYLDNLTLLTCFSFENVKKLFDIHASLKFALAVARRDTERNKALACAFYLHDFDWLFSGAQHLSYTREFVDKTGGQHLTFIELRSALDAAAAQVCYANAITFALARRDHEIDIGRELNMTDDAWRFTPSERVSAPTEDSRDPQTASLLRAKGFLPLHEGKTFHQYMDHWDARPRYLVALSDVSGKSTWLEITRFYRLAFRDIANSTNERTGIFALLPPGVLCGNKAPCERTPARRKSWTSLALLAVSDAYAFDFILRCKVRASINLFILDGCPVPPSAFKLPRSLFLAHSALRLTCNHEGYAPLWQEQLGEAWREPTPPHTWPVLSGDDARWKVRAAIDAVVAEAYGLTRAQYAHVLASFSHKSYRAAPDLCLAAFDDLQSKGLEAYTRAHDPYWDIPLVETLPRPVIDLPGAGDETATASPAPPADGGQPGAFRLTAPEPKKTRKKKGP